MHIFHHLIHYLNNQLWVLVFLLNTIWFLLFQISNIANRKRILHARFTRLSLQFSLPFKLIQSYRLLTQRPDLTFSSTVGSTQVWFQGNTEKHGEWTSAPLGRWDNSPHKTSLYLDTIVCTHLQKFSSRKDVSFLVLDCSERKIGIRTQSNPICTF